MSPAEARDEATSREAAAWRLRALHQYIVTRGEDLYLKMLMVDHLMHTDLHPGNIIVEPNAPALVLVDAGAARLSFQPRSYNDAHNLRDLPPLLACRAAARGA